MPVPDFSPGEVLTAAAMDSIGLWLVKTQTVGTGVTSVQVTGAFSANYQNYRIIYTGGTLSATVNLRLEIGNAATGYYNQLIYALYNSTGAPVSNVPDNNATRWNFVGAGNTSWAQLAVNVFNPFATTRTTMSSEYIDPALLGTGGGFLDNANSYSSFTISPASGTMTGGTIRVYGYRN
jgi:hypothetical protein